MSDDEVVASYVPPRYLLTIFIDEVFQTETQEIFRSIYSLRIVSKKLTCHYNVNGRLLH